MANAVFDVQTLFSNAWEAFKKNFMAMTALYLGIAVVLGLAGSLLSGFSSSMYFATGSYAVSIFLSVLFGIFMALIGIYVSLSMVKVYLAAYKGDAINVSLFKNTPAEYLRFLATMLIFAILIGITVLIFIVLIPLFFGLFSAGAAMVFVSLGTILTVAVAVCLFVAFFPIFYMVVDKKDTDLIEVFKKTYAMTKANMDQCIFFLVICIGFQIVGFLALGIGLLITIPVTHLAVAGAYKKLDGSK